MVEGELRNLWKKEQKGTFRSVRTSDDVENGVTSCLFVRASADRMPICWSTVQIYKCMVLEEKAEAKEGIKKVIGRNMTPSQGMEPAKHICKRRKRS